ncbi:uncharacterized protein [Euwallacea similis]|uniref:uncharacterized protein n=1 Tax=Euwallacea similis TaxID=1736056 RepID=UPI00344E3C2E
MSLAYFNDITVYFHMRNHYRALKNVKSIVDTSIPGSFKSPMAVNGLGKRLKGVTNEHLRRIYNTSPRNQTPKPQGLIKKHNCLNTEPKSKTSLIGADSSPRPNKKKPQNTDPSMRLARSYLTGRSLRSEKISKFRQKKKRSLVASTSSSNTASETQSLQMDLEPREQRRSDSPVESSKSLSLQSPRQDSTRFTSAPRDHEYLLFLLRITEDIIFYSNSDVKDIFKTHMDMNKDRLDTQKMHLHIANLCKELNINCKEFQNPFDDNIVPPDSLQPQHVFNQAFKSCQDCSFIRSSSLYYNNFEENDWRITEKIGETVNTGDFSNSLLKLLEKFSLGRVTEPVAFSSTMGSVLNGVTSEEEPKDFDSFVRELDTGNKTTEFEDIKSSVRSENDLIDLVELPHQEQIPADPPKIPTITLPVITSIPQLDLKTPIKSTPIENRVVTSTENLNEEKLTTNTSFATSEYKSEETSREANSSNKINNRKNENTLMHSIHDSAEPQSISNKFEPNSSTTTNINDEDLKLILSGPIKEEDYVMLKGPIYVYKPLLTSEPRLILIGDSEVKKSRRDSMDSHRTFIVPKEPSLHSLDLDNSMDNNDTFLELARAAYCQFADMKLLHSDYDLTPEKDESGSKYHHLIVDASSSVSGANMTETLLLNDDYLVVKGFEEKKEETNTIEEDYVKWQPKLYENSYVMHRKLVSSASMPKLKFFGERRESFVKHSSEQLLMDVEAISQHSSLRSEGEALPVAIIGEMK